MKKKSDAFAAFKHYKAYAENQLGVKVKATRDDKGGEYMSKEWDQFCAAAGIHRQHTIRDEPHQNDVAERANRTLAEGITTMLNEAHLPASFCQIQQPKRTLWVQQWAQLLFIHRYKDIPESSSEHNC